MDIFSKVAPALQNLRHVSVRNKTKISRDEINLLTEKIHNIQGAGEVAKTNLSGSVSLSIANAVDSLVQALKGEKVTQCAYVYSDVVKGVEYFATPVELGPNGVEKIHGTGKLNKNPRNAFEEQIQWTNKGKLWPYPIDNEYQFGDEHQTSFMDHVFLEPYWRKHKVPFSKAVEQFMELVLNGLSKNPYMSVAKKREHIDWFANYFKEQLSKGGKYRKLL